MQSYAILVAMHSLPLLVMWLGCWVLGVAFAAVELPHLLQQVGPNLHRFDAGRVVDCCIVYHHKVK